MQVEKEDLELAYDLLRDYLGKALRLAPDTRTQNRAALAIQDICVRSARATATVHFRDD